MDPVCVCPQTVQSSTVTKMFWEHLSCSAPVCVISCKSPEPNDGKRPNSEWIFNVFFFLWNHCICNPSCTCVWPHRTHFTTVCKMGHEIINWVTTRGAENGLEFLEDLNQIEIIMFVFVHPATLRVMKRKGFNVKQFFFVWRFSGRTTTNSH